MCSNFEKCSMIFVSKASCKEVILLIEQQGQKGQAPLTRMRQWERGEDGCPRAASSELKAEGSEHLSAC